MSDDGFKAFYEADIDRLRAFAYRLTGNWSDADDLAQDAMVRTMRAWRRVDKSPTVYVRAVMVNLHRSWLRRAAVEARHRFGARPVLAEPDGEAAELWAEIQRLPVRQRQVLVLHFYEDIPQNEIAQILGCPAGTVNSLVHRALAKLRVQLALTEISGGEA